MSYKTIIELKRELARLSRLWGGDRSKRAGILVEAGKRYIG